MSECPYGEAILHYAKERGLKNARLEYEFAFGWCLYGDGQYNGWPLVWAVARELGIIDGGCGDTTSHQIRPELF